MKKESIGILENLWTMDGVEKVGAPLFLTISIFIHCKNLLNATSLSSSIVTIWVHANVGRISLNTLFFIKNFGNTFFIGTHIDIFCMNCPDSKK
jgi:hypothetical protein